MLLAAIVWLVTTFASQWHQVVVPHARCPEHGELLQVMLGERSDGPELSTAPADQQHDECALHALAGAFPAPRPPSVLTPVAAPSEEVTTLASIRLAREPLRFAPKTSPPPIA